MEKYSYSWKSTHTLIPFKSQVLTIIQVLVEKYLYSWKSIHTHGKLFILDILQKYAQSDIQLLIEKYSYLWKNTCTNGIVLIIRTLGKVLLLKLMEKVFILLNIQLMKKYLYSEKRSCTSTREKRTYTRYPSHEKVHILILIHSNCTQIHE